MENQYLEVMNRIKNWHPDVIKQVEQKLRNFRGFIKVQRHSLDHLPSNQLKVSLPVAYKMITNKYSQKNIYFVDNTTTNELGSFNETQV